MHSRSGSPSTGCVPRRAWLGVGAGVGVGVANYDGGGGDGGGVRRQGQRRALHDDVIVPGKEDARAPG